MIRRSWPCLIRKCSEVCARVWPDCWYVLSIPAISCLRSTENEWHDCEHSAAKLSQQTYLRTSLFGTLSFSSTPCAVEPASRCRHPSWSELRARADRGTEGSLLYACLSCVSEEEGSWYVVGILCHAASRYFRSLCMYAWGGNTYASIWNSH